MKDAVEYTIISFTLTSVGCFPPMATLIYQADYDSFF